MRAVQCEGGRCRESAHAGPSLSSSLFARSCPTTTATPRPRRTPPAPSRTNRSGERGDEGGRGRSSAVSRAPAAAHARLLPHAHIASLVNVYKKVRCGSAAARGRGHRSRVATRADAMPPLFSSSGQNFHKDDLSQSCLQDQRGGGQAGDVEPPPALSLGASWATIAACIDANPTPATTRPANTTGFPPSPAAPNHSPPHCPSHWPCMVNFRRVLSRCACLRCKFLQCGFCFHPCF